MKRKSAWSILLTAALVLTWAGCSGASRQQAAGERGTWKTVEMKEQPLPRHEHAYVQVGDRFYLVGGRGDRPVQAYDPATGRWTTLAAPPVEMHHFQAVAYDGKIYVVGALSGGFPAEQPLPNVYIYDPETDRWTKGMEIPEDRRRGAAGAVVHDGQIYVVAGIQNGHTDGHVAWLDRFDPKTGAWERLADAPRARDHFQAGIVDGKLYAAAGRRSSWASREPFELTIPEVDAYDLAAGTWTTLPAASNLPTQRAGTATVVHDGRLIVLGGESGSQQPAHAEVEAFDPATGKWTTLAPMLEGRHGMQAILRDGRIYVAAGSRVRGADEIQSQEVYTVPE